MTLVPFLLLSLGAAYASPLSRDTSRTTLALMTKINTAPGSLVEKDRTRHQSTNYASLESTDNEPLSALNAGVCYLAEVGVGTPPTNHLLLVDTGSSNTWIGANSTYAVTSSSMNTGNAVSVPYGSGSFSGEEWLDTVTLTSEWVVKQQSIGVASSAQGANGFDGILGLGPTSLTQGTVENTYEVPTVTDNLYAQKTISQEVLGIFFAPFSESDSDGALTFGGYDDSVITSPVNYVSLAENTAASAYWGINQSISYGMTNITSTTDGIVDTGTTLIYIPSDAYQQYQSLTGATLDSTTELLTISSSQYDKLETLYFNIGGTSYGLTPNGQIWPRSLNYLMGGSSDAIYLVVNDISTVDAGNLGFINGFSFLQRFYSVFDTTNQRMGFAETIYTNSETN